MSATIDIETIAAQLTEDGLADLGARLHEKRVDHFREMVTLAAVANLRGPGSRDTLSAQTGYTNATIHRLGLLHPLVDDGETIPPDAHLGVVWAVFIACGGTRKTDADLDIVAFKRLLGEFIRDGLSLKEAKARLIELGLRDDVDNYGAVDAGPGRIVRYDDRQVIELEEDALELGGSALSRVKVWPVKEGK